MIKEFSTGISECRRDFPILSQQVNGKPLVYLDNAATTQKPRCVIDAIREYYEKTNANVHRGIHELSERATSAYEASRARLARFFGAEGAADVVFTRGTTEGLNLLANILASTLQKSENRILLTEMEHHSNIVPWQMLAEKIGATIDFIPIIPETGALDLEAAEAFLARKPAIFSCTHVSNTLGTVNPVAELFSKARKNGTICILDAAQSAGHRHLDFGQLQCDFLVCSGHKMCAPMGIGIVVGKAELWNSLPPWQGGGDMISKVTFQGSTWNVPPQKFEAGTPNVEGAIALAVAAEYLDTFGREKIAAHDSELVKAAWKRLASIPGVRLLGPNPEELDHAGALSFKLSKVHAHDVVTLANEEGIALRGGHHCNQPLMKKLGVPSTARASFYLYNTCEEVEVLATCIEKIQRTFS